MTSSETGGAGRFVRALVVVVTVECGIALIVRTVSAYRVAEGRGSATDYLAAGGVLWILVLAVSALLVARRVEALGRRVRARDVDLETLAEPRRRLASIMHRTGRVLATPQDLQIALQPIVDLESGRWVGVEALARFPDNDPPERWFAEAHEAGMGVALERITIEITEHAAVARYEDIRAALLPHRERGVRLAVDDTGAGYASFAHVLLLRPDVIKLDRSLLTEIAHDAARRAFVTAIVLLALELDAAVTAEGVETMAELDVLRSLGVDTVQGYLVARPSVEPGDWAAWAVRNWPAHCGLVPPRPPVVDGERTGTGWAGASSPPS